MIAAAVAIKLLTPVKAEYVSPQKRHLVQEVFGTGTVEARVLVTAGSKITGRVKRLYADQGDFVRKGQLLASIESDDLHALVNQAVDARLKSVSMEGATRSDLERAEANIKAAEYAVQKAEATMRLARQTFDRYEKLYGKGAISRQELDEKQAALDEAMRQRENLEAAKAAARADADRVAMSLKAAGHETGAGTALSAYAKARYEDANIRASMDGVVVSRDAEEGDAVVPGSSIFRIADPETVWVKANIDEALCGGIALGKRAAVYLRSDRNMPLPGSVSRIAQESDRVTEEMEADVSFPLNDDGRLHLGEQADVYINGFEKDCLAVPVNAVTVRDGGTGVFVAADGKARFVPVKTGIYTKEFVEVAGGLRESDKVILLNDKLNAGLKEGARVRLAQSVSGGCR